MAEDREKIKKGTHEHQTGVKGFNNQKRNVQDKIFPKEEKGNFV